MMISAADIDVIQGEDGNLYFHHAALKGNDSLSVPVNVGGAISVVEFFFDHGILHPANGEDMEFSPIELLAYLEENNHE